MAHLSQAELKEIGRKAAAEVYGPGVAQDVEVVGGEDWAGEPAYFYSFLIQQDPDRKKAERLRTSLSHKVRDELVERDDFAYPYISVLTEQDWDRRERALSV
jgi:hypothetical protein